MKKIMLVFGTRPEAIKMCPLVLELKKRNDVQTVVCVTGQHREMLDGVLQTFGVQPDHDLNVMKENQTLSHITSEVLLGMERILDAEKPNLVLVHGDTTTAFAAGLAAFYRRIPVGHVEAGLRTGNIHAPYPEEFNRVAVSAFASLHFAPTDTARHNLLREGKKAETVFVTGNTAIDAIRYSLKKEYSHPILTEAGDRRILLLTAHRRENFGQGFYHIFKAVKRFAMMHPEVFFIYPVHPNPEVKKVAESMLSGIPNIRLTAPLSTEDFHNFLARAYLVLTDSGGVQEEAPYFAVPVLVLRDTTERPEGIEAGTAKLVGADEERLLSVLEGFFRLPEFYEQMAKAKNPYGDGHAAEKIVEILFQQGFMEKSQKTE